MKRKIKSSTVGLKLNTKVHTGVGIASAIMALLSIIFIAAAIYISATMSRDYYLNLYLIGGFEIAAFILSLVGIAFGIVGEFTEETIKRFAHIGLSINSILLILHIVVISSGY